MINVFFHFDIVAVDSQQLKPCKGSSDKRNSGTVQWRGKGNSCRTMAIGIVKSGK